MDVLGNAEASLQGCREKKEKKKEKKKRYTKKKKKKKIATRFYG